MIAITKGMVALSALMSAGFITAFDLVGTRADERFAAAQVSQRFPLTSEMFTPVSLGTLAMTKLNAQNAIEMGRRGDKLMVAGGDCDRQGWPYFSQHCLVASDGEPMRKVSRVITIERRTGENTSELMRVPVTEMAQR